MVDTLVLRLTEDHTTVVGALAPTASDSAADHDVSLLGLVAKTVGLVSTRRLVDTCDLGALTVLPSANSEEEADRIGLLVAPTRSSDIGCEKSKKKKRREYIITSRGGTTHQSSSIYL